MISKGEVGKLAKLARIALTPEEEEKLANDLDGILGHFEELKAVDTDGVEPLAGGTDVVNGFRADDGYGRVDAAVAKADFPEREGAFLRVPPVFE